MQVTIKGFIYAQGTRHFDTETMKSVEGPGYHFYMGSNIGGSKYFEDYVMVCPHNIVAEIPADFDPRSELVKNLEREKKRVMAEFNKRVTEIDAQIQTYLAIEA